MVLLWAPALPVVERVSPYEEVANATCPWIQGVFCVILWNFGSRGVPENVTVFLCGLCSACSTSLE